jgi:hypothetical protein
MTIPVRLGGMPLAAKHIMTGMWQLHDGLL